MNTDKNQLTRLNMGLLVEEIKKVHTAANEHASKAVNTGLTLRNWVIGAYIAEYEYRGSDRAEYGEKLLPALADRLKQQKVSACGKRQLYQYLSFYRVYPEIVRTLSPQLKQVLHIDLTAHHKVRTASAQLTNSPERMVAGLSYSHFEELISIDDETKRLFYEFECLRGNWSVRELKRQLNSLYYERSGLSENKQKLAKMVAAGAETKKTGLNIRDPYVFEFLGLKPHEVMYENDLEQSLLQGLQELLLELGHGFCFEAQQKRILIGETQYFVDLVFYNRILKCHVLIELKLGEFSHENIGQLNTYVNWFKSNEMTDGDNPPVGILLCTNKNEALVEYALAGMDNSLFVSKYQLELPNKETMEQFLLERIKHQ